MGARSDVTAGTIEWLRRTRTGKCGQPHERVLFVVALLHSTNGFVAGGFVPATIDQVQVTKELTYTGPVTYLSGRMLLALRTLVALVADARALIPIAAAMVAARIIVGAHSLCLRAKECRD